MRKILLVVSIIILSLGLVYAKDISATTDYCDNSKPVQLPNNGPSDVIDYTNEWTITLGHIASVGLTPVCIGSYPAGETLLWVSSGGLTSNADPNYILIYNLRTRTLVDSFPQANSTLWGYRDMCFYNGYVYAGAEANLDKIDPVTHAVVGTYAVTGISGSVIRALTDNNVEDSLWATNWAVPIYKFWNQGGAVRTVQATNTYSTYGLAYDPHGYVWGSCQNQPTADLVKYSYPGFTVLDYVRVTELLTGELAGGCEMWKDTFLLYLGQCTPLDKVFCLRLYTVPLINDVSVEQILSPGASHLVNTLMTPSARVKNRGSATNSFTVRCSIINAGGTVRYVNSQSVTSLVGGDTVTKTFSGWTPSVVELLTVYVTTYLGGDENPGNDRMTKTCDVGNYIIIGTGTTTSYTNPINRFYNYSATEGIYLQSEIGQSGNILNIAYYKGSGTDLNPIDSVYIYLKHTTATTLATGTFDMTGYTLVYSGQYPNTVTDGWLAVDLPTPFNYNNTDNLQILVLKYFQAYIGTTLSPNWRYTTTTPTYMSRQYFSDTQRPVPLSTSLTQIYNRPNFRLSVTPPVPNDVGVDAILAPLATHAVNASMTPSARVKNYGTDGQTNFKVYCKIVGPGSVVRRSDSVTVASLAAGVADTFDFTAWTPTITELETVKIWTALAGDANTSNDLKTRTTDIITMIDAGVTAITTPGGSTATKRLSFTPQVTVTNNGSYSADVPVIAEVWSAAQGITEGFEGTTFPPDGWVRYNNDGGANQWVRNTAYPNTGSAHASCTYETSILRNDDWLISPQIVVPLSGQLRFWYRTSTALTPYDSLHVRLSTTGNAIPDFTVLLDNFNILNTTYAERVIDLSAYSNQNVYIAFVDVGLYAWTLCIDDVYLAYVPPALVYRDSILVSVPSGTDASVPATFNLAFGPMTEGTYLFKSYTKLAGDLVPANDMMTRAFTVNPLTLTLASPANGITTADNTPSFSWNEVTAAESYRIEVDNNDDFSSPEFAGTLGDLEIESDPLLDGLYYWHVRVETPGTPDPYSAVRTLTIDTQGPVPPVLVLPEDDATLETATPTFTWEAATDAVNYNLVVDDGTKAVVINIETSELTYTPTTPLDEGTFTWTVRAQDALENWGLPSAPWSFSISLGTPGWAIVDPIPAALDLKPGKFVKDGGSMIGVGGAKDGDDIYMFPGNKSWYFYKYTRGTPGIFTTLESIPYGFKPTDPTKYNKKKIGKGAALCYDGTGIIYATKGNGTVELWAYDILANTWTAKAFVPVPKALKGGTSLAYLGGKLYLLAGGQKKTDLNNFYVYDVATDAWTTGASLELGANIKVWKDGACLAELGGVIYALKTNDKANLFYGYDILGNVWNPVDSMPVVESLYGKANKKVIAKDGAAMVSGGSSIYAIKGGGANVFWKFNGTAWSKLESIPRLHKKSVAKTGAAMAFANNRIWLMKGNNTSEFWCYTRSALNATRLTPTTVVSTMVEKTSLTNVFSFNVAPNPFNRTTIIRYTVPVAGKVSVKLYSTSGRVVETINNSYLNQGNYTTTLNASTLASGVYFLRYEDRTNRAEIKLIVE